MSTCRFDISKDKLIIQFCMFMGHVSLDFNLIYQHSIITAIPQKCKDMFISLSLQFGEGVAFIVSFYLKTNSIQNHSKSLSVPHINNFFSFLAYQVFINISRIAYFSFPVSKSSCPLKKKKKILKNCLSILLSYSNNLSRIFYIWKVKY